MENLKNRRAELMLSINNLNSKYHKLIDSFLKTCFPNTVWFVNFFDADHLNISMELESTYSNGTHRKYTIEIDHGYKSWYSYNDDEQFHMNINPFTGGTFTLLENNELREYYGMVGNLCSNENFRNGLIELLKKYYVEYSPINEEMKSVRNEISKIERVEAEANRLAKKNEEYIKYKTGAETITDGYFVIDTGDGVITNPDERIIYRKKPVKILAGPMSYQEANVEVNSYYKSEYHKYKAVEVSKIKFTE